MRTVNDILELLRGVKPELVRFGVTRIGVFGSYARALLQIFGLSVS